jgi:hypothetical protein
VNGKLMKDRKRMLRTDLSALSRQGIVGSLIQMPADHIHMVLSGSRSFGKKCPGNGLPEPSFLQKLRRHETEERYEEA